jgi:hypothetical protein
MECSPRMAKTKTYLGIDAAIWRCIQQKSAKEHGTRYAPPSSNEGAATTKTPFGDIVLGYVFDPDSSSLKYAIRKKPFMLPDDGIWVGVGETIDDCRQQAVGAPKKNFVIERLKHDVENAAKQVLSPQTVEQTVRVVHEDFHAALRSLVRAKGEPFPEVLEANGKPMLCLRRREFENWGRTVEHTPELTFFPRSKIGVCRLVKWAAAHGKRVRSSGYRHTWSDLYAQEDQILISTLSLQVAETLPAFEPGIDPTNELQGIKIVGEIKEGFETKALCKIGAATTNEQFRRWCLDDDHGNRQWTVPLNVIMVEITWGGSNAQICHGGGWKNKTLSDLVAEIEFVNAKGELQWVDDPDQLRAAAGCFGLLGIVTAVTLKLDRMTYAVMKPEKPKVALTIPPPKDFAVPEQIDMSGISDADLDAAWNRFVDRCEHHYYSEWFWFPYEDRCWVNTWRNDGLKEEAVDYPDEASVILEQAQSYLSQLLNDSVFKLLPGMTQAKVFANGAMMALPADRAICTPLIDALHFRRGIQNMRVLDMELEIPIPPRSDDPHRPDWTICQKAWWSAIELVYRRKDAPMRIALEMRVMGGSEVFLAPQYGNRFGTCSIEVLTTLNTKKEDWLSFMQEVTDAWMKLRDGNGAPLNIRPHWAKQWEGLTFDGKPAVDYLKTAYREPILEFKKRLAAVASSQGYSTADLKARFSNPLLDDLFEEVFKAQ